MSEKSIFVVSDSTGETAERVVRAALVQFPSHRVRVRLFTRVRDREAVADVVKRALGRPIAGSFEVIGWLSAVALALALGYTQAHRGHVAMTLLTDALPDRGKSALDVLNSAAGLVLFSIVAWVVLRYGQTLQESGSLSETLKALVYPWVYVVAVGFVALALSLLVDTLLALARTVRPAAGAGR